MRRAEEFIKASLSDEVDLEDIVSASGVSRRTLHAGFRRYRHSTPLSFLKCLRLEAAKGELELAHRSRKSATEVATEFGFFHLSKSYHRITLIATLLAIALIAEIAMIMLLNVAIIAQKGLPAFNVADLSPSSIFAPGLGVALIYAFNSMIGFEGTAIYQEEAANRKVTIPRATYVSVVIAALLYAMTAWCPSTAVGSLEVAKVAGADPGHFVTARANDYLGAWSAHIFSVLVVTSAFAAVFGLFNNSARYIYALARDGVLPQALAKTHPVYKSPHIAGIFLSVVLAVVTATAALAGLDPLMNISPMFVGLGSVGLMVLLALTALGIPVFFARQGIYGLTTTVVPALGGIAIAGATWSAITKFIALTGVDSPLVDNLPWVLAVAAIAGVIQALWLRSHSTQSYGRIGVSRIEDSIT